MLNPFILALIQQKNLDQVMNWHRINLKDQKSIDIIKGIDVVLNVLLEI